MNHHNLCRGGRSWAHEYVGVVSICGWGDADLVITQRPNTRFHPTGVPPDLVGNVQDASG